MPCTLVRLAGCPLNCSYCDTPRAIPMNSGNAMSIESIMQRIRASARPLVLITGGEPMAQRALPLLLDALRDETTIIQLETSGAYDISDIEPPVRRILDIKTPGSGEVARNKWSNLQQLRAGDEIKFVLTDEADYRWSVEIIRQHDLENKPATILFSPCWGHIDVRDLARRILDDRLNVRLQLQMHKHIWGAETEGV